MLVFLPLMNIIRGRIAPTIPISFDGEQSYITSGSTTSPGAARRYYRIDYAPRINPSKGRRFRGRYDADGNFHDID